MLGLVLVVAGAAGCASRISQRNYERVQNGMTLAQVQEILGEGQLQQGLAGGIGNLGGSVSVYQWRDEQRVITVTFINDKVTAKSSENLDAG